MKIKEFTLIIGRGGYFHIRGSFSDREEAILAGNSFINGDKITRASKPGRNRGAKAKAYIVELKEVIG